MAGGGWLGRFKSDESDIERLLLDYFQGNLERRIKLLQNKINLLKKTTDSNLTAQKYDQIKTSKTNNIYDGVAESLIRKQKKLEQLEYKMELLQFFKSQLEELMAIELTDTEQELIEMAYSNDLPFWKIANNLGYAEVSIKLKRKQAVEKLESKVFELVEEYPF